MSTPTGDDSERWGISARPELGLDIWLDNSKESKDHGDPKKKQSVLIRTISSNKKVRSALFHVSNDVTLIPTFSQGPDFASITQENFDDEQLIYSRPNHIPPQVAQAVASRRIIGVDLIILLKEDDHILQLQLSPIKGHQLQPMDLKRLR